MAFERTPKNSPRGPYVDHDSDDGQNRGSGRDYSYSSARDYAAGGMSDREMSGRDRGRGQGDQSSYGGNHAQDYRGSYASDGHRFTDDRTDRDEGQYGRQQNHGHYRQGGSGHIYGRPEQGQRYGEGQRYGQNQDRQQQGRQANYGAQSQGYDYDDRGFVSRAGDEVRSWFGDSDAEQRREMDQRQDQSHNQGQSGSSGSDDHYHSWRKQQMDELDRDYSEYRDENRSRFESEFSTFRATRQTQRSCLDRVKEQMEVVGSDGQHVGTVDKVRGDRILLTKNDQAAGGHHHSIPSRWIDGVDDTVKISKTADEAHKLWRDEERNQAMLGDDKTRTGGQAYTQHGAATGTQAGAQEHDDSSILNRSTSGTY